MLMFKQETSRNAYSYIAPSLSSLRDKLENVSDTFFDSAILECKGLLKAFNDGGDQRDTLQLIYNTLDVLQFTLNRMKNPSQTKKYLTADQVNSISSEIPSVLSELEGASWALRDQVIPGEYVRPPMTYELGPEPNFGKIPAIKK